MDAIKVLGENRKARHEYSVEEHLECGLVLVGTEVKSLRTARFAFNDAYAQIKNGEVFLMNLQITPYVHGTTENHEPMRARKLLLHKEEIRKLSRKVDEKGYTLIPLKFYLKKGKVKLDLGICKGKKNYDKRQTIKERDIQRDMEREKRI